MKRIYQLPTLVILGLLSIYYLAIFLNSQKILTSLSKNFPLLFGYFIFMLLTIIPIGIKGGLVFYHGRRKSLRKVLLFSAIVLLLFGTFLLTNSDLSTIWKKILAGNFLSNYHRTIISFITLTVSYLFFFLLIEIIKLEDFIDNIKALPIVSPVFCFGGPAFWKTSLVNMKIPEADISFLGGVSFFCGVIFLLAILIFFVAKNFNTEGMKFWNITTKRNNYLKASLALIFFGIALLLFVCIDISFLIAR